MLRRVLVAIALSVWLGAACAPAPPDPPPPAPPHAYRDGECGYSLLIESAFAGTGDERWAVDIAIRESRCDPCAFYPGQSNCDAMPGTAAGLFQLLGHDDLLERVCLGGRFVWYDPWCNAWAARLLYDSSGRGPWRF